MTDSMVQRDLLQALERHTAADPQGVYDETLRSVSHRAADVRSLCKADIGSLVLWKRITAQARWAAELGMTPDVRVREVTGQAWAEANDASVPIPQAGLTAYRTLRRGLRGMGGSGALASAVLVACAPTRMAVWDRRAGAALSTLGRPVAGGNGFYGRYLEAVCELAGLMQAAAPEGLTVAPRHVDLALYTLGGR